MLDKDKLQDNIKQAIDECLQPALENAFNKILPKDTNGGQQAAKDFSEVATIGFSEPFAKRLASAIDYYIKNANIHGNMLLCGVTTVGSPVAQAQVVPLPISVQTLPVGQGGGIIPGVNSLMLGIN